MRSEVRGQKSEVEEIVLSFLIGVCLGAALGIGVMLLYFKDDEDDEIAY